MGVRNRLGRLTPPNPVATVVFAVVAALVFAGAQALSRRHLPEAELPLIFVFLLCLGAAHARFLTAWTRRVNRVTEALKSMAEGSDSWQMEPGDQLAADSLGAQMRRWVDELGQSINALRQDKRRAEMVLANMADGIIAVDCEGIVTVFNKAAARLFNQRDSVVMGSKVEEIDLHPEIARLAYECIETKADLACEVKLPGRPQKAISIRATPFRGGAGRSDCAMIILHDLSAIRRHEENQKEFVGNVSHELRTPLTAVRATAEALLDGAKNDEDLVDRFLQTIITESDRLSALIDDLMEIARLDAGITRLQKSSVRAVDCVNRAATVVFPQARAKQVELSIDVDEDLVVCCDEMQTVQMIRNLVDNAVKYTGEQGKVEIVARQSGSDLVILVRDTGIGIPHGEIDRVFERFYRVDKARSRRLGGTGLGLAIVRDIVNAHGGTIDIETQLGKGSTFTVVYPEVVGQTVPAAEGTPAPSPLAGEGWHCDPLSPGGRGLG